MTNIYVAILRRIWILPGFLWPLLAFNQSYREAFSPPTPGLAKVLVYREVNENLKKEYYPLIYNQEQMATLWNGSWYLLEVYRGTTELSLESEPPVGITINLETDKSYFVAVRINLDSIRPELVPVGRAEAERYLEENRLKKMGSFNPVRDSVAKVKSNLYWKGNSVYTIGAQLGGGVGFKDVAMVDLTTGGHATISAGGGVHLNINGSYRFTKNLDIQAEIGVQSSSLNPAVSNANITFTRYPMGASLRYTVPFSSHLRFNAGPGITSFRSPVLDADMSDLQDGYHLILYYKPAVGYTGTAELEYFFRSFSGMAGIRYYNCEYKISSGTIDGWPVDMSTVPEEFTTRDGTGLYFYLGFGYHL